MLWLAIHLPLLPLEVIRQSPDHTDKVIAVTDTCSHTGHSSYKPSSNRKTAVLLANRQAMARGIEPGISESTALALCNETILVPRHFDSELALLQSLAETAYSFSSQVMLYTSLNLQHSLLLEISGSLRLFNGLDNLQKNIEQAFNHHPLAIAEDQDSNSAGHGFAIQTALSSTARMSELKARFQYSKKKKSNSSLTDIPVSFMDCKENDKQHCHNMGIKTVQEALSIPREALGRRLSEGFIEYLNRIEGKKPDPLPLFQPAENFNQFLFFTFGLQKHDDLQNPMARLLDSLVSFLRMRQYQCTSIQWRFVRFSKVANVIDIHFSRPQNNQVQMLSLSQLQLDQLPMDSPVEHITLKANEFIPLQDNQGTDRYPCLFKSSPSTSQGICILPDGDSRLLQDKIQLRLGEKSILQVKVKDRHLPEQSNIIKPLKKGYLKKILKVDQPEKNRHNNINQPEEIKPLWLADPAIEINIHVTDNTYWINKSQRLEILKGPERIMNNWWHKAQTRDYFIAGSVTEDAGTSTEYYLSIYWIYQEKTSGNWYLQGVF